MQGVWIGNKLVYSFTGPGEIVEHLKGFKGLVISVNAERLLDNDPVMVKMLNENLGFPDGVGAVWAIRQKGYKAAKIAGVELWLDVVKNFYSGKSFYLIGGTDLVMEKTIEKLREEFPGIKIVGSRNGFFRDNEDRQATINDVAAKKPDVVFVAMGSPRQDLLMQDLNSIHPAIYMGIGGSLDVYSGQLRRAPKFMIKLGLEWAFRLMLEPTRIKRQLVLFKFLYLLCIRKV